MKIAGVRLDGQHEIIFCNVGQLNPVLGDLVSLQKGAELLTARVVIAPQLLEVAQTDSDLPLVSSLVNFSAAKNVVLVEPTQLKPVCQRQPCCVEWLTPFASAVAQLKPCCLDAAQPVTPGQAVCALEPATKSTSRA